MALFASKTFVTSKGGEISPPEKLSISVGGIKASNFVVLSKQVKESNAKKVDKHSSLNEWRAEKAGKRSSFLDDMLTDNE